MSSPSPSPAPASAHPETFGNELLVLASEIRFDFLLEDPATTDVTIRFIAAVRKSLLDVPPDRISPDLIEAERIITRLYQSIGSARVNLAFTRGRNDR